MTKIEAIIRPNRFDAVKEALKEHGVEGDRELYEVNKQFVEHSSNYRLAKLIVYTNDKTPHDIGDEIIQKLGITGQIG